MISLPCFRAMVPSAVASRRRLTLAATGAAILVAAGFANAQAPAADPVLAKVNGVEIHQSDLALAEEDIGQQVPAKDEQGKRDYLVNYLTDMILLSKAAEAKKIPDTAEFKRRITVPGFATTAGPLNVLVAANRKGVDPFADPDAAFASLSELKPNLVKTYNTGSELVNLFSTGEVVVAAAQDFAFPAIKAAVPSARWAELAEGEFVTFNTVNIVKGTKQKELALSFIDWHLSLDVQKALAVAGTDAPANAEVELSPEQAAPWTYGEAVIMTLHKPDYAKLNGAKPDWGDRWNEIFGQ